MTQTEQRTLASDRPRTSTFSKRSGNSRKLLASKAAEKVELEQARTDVLEVSFPPAPNPKDGNVENSATELTTDAGQSEPGTDVASATDATPDAPPATDAATAATAAAWSAEDEAALQALLARRKASGFQRPGRDVSNQLIKPGAIKPNPNTVVAVIVGIVAEKGAIGRAELIDAVASATFTHPKAQPSDKAWCQGYVAGAIRSGFLAMEAAPAAAPEAA